MKNDQIKAIMTAIIFVGYNISNGCGITDDEADMKDGIDTAEKITEEICDRYTGIS